MSPKSSPISNARHALDLEPQSIDAPLSAAAAFLVLVVKDDKPSIATARSVVGSTDDLVKDLRIRANSGLFTCYVGILHRVWGPLTGKPAPRELAPFREVKGARHTAVATEGDLLYHIRAGSMDLIIGAINDMVQTECPVFEPTLLLIFTRCAGSKVVQIIGLPVFHECLIQHSYHAKFGACNPHVLRVCGRFGVGRGRRCEGRSSPLGLSAWRH